MSNMEEAFQQQQTPLHDGGIIPNLTGYSEKAVSPSSLGSGDQVFPDESPEDPSEGKPVDIGFGMTSGE